MSDNSIYFNSLHQIDIDQDSVNEIQLDLEKRDLNEYITNLINNIIAKPDTREFEFSSDTVEIKNNLDEIIDSSKHKEIATNIANRFLRIKKSTQEKIKMQELQKGSLLQSYLKINDANTYIITLIVHSGYIDTNDLKKRSGMPLEKQTLKSFIAKFSENNEIDNILIYDSIVNISKYWWSDFLELKEINDDQYNTKTAFNSIDSLLTKQIKNNFPSDYTYLRNKVVGYFGNNEEFQFTEMMDKVFDSYDPIESGLNIKEFNEKIKELPDEKKFDRSFNIEPKVIKARMRRQVIKLHDKIYLDVKDSVDNLKDIIYTEKNDADEKLVIIKSEEGYNRFNRGSD